MRRYESVVILDPELADDDIKNFTERYSTLIKSNGGEIIKIEDWGFKRLAYQVKKKDRGRYILFDFVGLPALMAEMERQLKISDEAMKFLSVKLDDDVDLEAFKAASEEKAAAEAAKLTKEEPPAEAAEEPTPAAEEAGEPEVLAEAPQAAGEVATPEASKEPESAEPAGSEPEQDAPRAKSEGEIS